MQDRFIVLEEIKKELCEIEDLGSALSNRLALITQKIRYIISEIKLCETMSSAEKYFNVLDEIQLVLASLVFKEEIGIPKHLRNFVSDFDNLEFSREYYYQKIRNDQYFF